MMESLLSGLTVAQREAVCHVDGPMLVLAGPGSGKTRVITCRVAYLISQGVRAGEILAITFTNKAAKEMAERVAKLGVGRGSRVCTFHSLCARLLREFHDAAGLMADFSIYDDSDQRGVMREALKRCELDSKHFPPGPMLSRISGYKNNLQLPEDVGTEDGDFLGKIARRVYGVYQEILEQSGALDFDDLLLKTAMLLRNQPGVRQQLNDRWRYVMIDEYQDTNQSQYQLARGLSLVHSNLMATGDPDQSIYQWRGADIGNILAFEEDYPSAKVVRLEENFRSTPEVLAVADEVIRRNRKRKEKGLFTRKSSGPRGQLACFEDERDEAKGLVEWVKGKRAEGMAYGEMAVFYRMNSMSRVLEEGLRKAGVPYQVVRGVEFYRRAEIKDILGYLHFLQNRRDQAAWKRVINRPARGIGEKTIERLALYSERNGKDLWEVMKDVEMIGTLNAGTKKKVIAFVGLIRQLEGMLARPVDELIGAVYELSGLRRGHEAEQDQDAVDNVKELIQGAREFQERNEGGGGLSEFLQEVALVSDADRYEEGSGCVSLMTLHTAKGLEFEGVWIAGVEDGILPHSRSAGDEDGLEEERRLLFVGITRSKKELVLSYAKMRRMQGGVYAGIASEFVRGVAGLEVVQKEDPWEPEEELETSDDWEDQTLEGECFGVGQMVVHPKFGVGRIERQSKGGGGPKVVVSFRNSGQKTLLLKYAKLERM